MALRTGITLVLSIALATPARAETTITYFHNDALGSPVAATDESGTLLWSERYRPFGERIVKDPAAADQSQWYTGHKRDEDSGLTYMGARYYDPLIGRFMGMDPAGVEEGDPHTFNRYAYVANNPYRYVDPDGRAVCAGICIGIAAGALALWNLYDTATEAVGTAQTLADNNASAGEKALAVGVFALGMVDPTPGNTGRKVGGKIIDALTETKWLPAKGQRDVNWESVEDWRKGIQSGDVVMKNEDELTQMGANIIVTSPDADGTVAVIAGQHRVAAHFMATGKPPPESSLTRLGATAKEIGVQPWK